MATRRVKYRYDKLGWLVLEYFHLGNPDRYDGWKFNWFAGRKLGSMVRNEVWGYIDAEGAMFADVENRVTFTYDAAGLRTRKVHAYSA